MEEEKAHNLYQHFSDVNAAARSGRGLGFNAAGSSRAINNAERWQPDMQDDILNPDSSWAERSKKGVGNHTSAEEHTQYSLSDKFAQADAERRADKTQKREHIANDADTRHGEHHSSKRTHSKHLGDEERHVRDRDDERHGRDEDGHRRDVDRDRIDRVEERPRSSRHDQQKQNRHHPEHDSTRRHDKTIRHDRKRHHSEHETRSRHDREGKHDQEWRRSEHDSGGRYDRHEWRERSELHNRSVQDERSTEQRHSTDDRGREQRHSSARVFPHRQDAVRNRKESKVDFEKLLPGYAKMTPAERMKARTKLLLDKSSKQDSRDARDGQWTRFVFNKDALLEEEGATPADAFGGDANPVSLRLPQAKAETKQRMQTAEEAHEAAIFGKSSSSAPRHSQPQQDKSSSMQGGVGLGGGQGLGATMLRSSPEPVKVDIEPDSRHSQPPNTLAAAVIVDAQPGLSWRERAALKRKELAAQ